MVRNVISPLENKARSLGERLRRLFFGGFNATAPRPSQPPQQQQAPRLVGAPSLLPNTPWGRIMQREAGWYSPTQQAVYGFRGIGGSDYFSNAPVPPPAKQIMLNTLAQFNPYAVTAKQNAQNLIDKTKNQLAIQGTTLQGNTKNIVSSAMQQGQDIWGNQPERIDLNQAQQQAEARINRNLIRQQRLAAKTLADTMGARGLAGSGIQAGMTARQAADIGRQMADTQANLAEKYTQLGLQQRGQDINMYGMRANALTGLLGQGMGLQGAAARDVFGQQAQLGREAMGMQGTILRDILANQGRLLGMGMQLTPQMEQLRQSAYWRPMHEAMSYESFQNALKSQALKQAMLQNSDEMLKYLIGLGPQYAGVAASLINNAFGTANNAFANWTNLLANQMAQPESGGTFGFGANLGPFSASWVS